MKFNIITNELILDDIDKESIKRINDLNEENKAFIDKIIDYNLKKIDIYNPHPQSLVIINGFIEQILDRQAASFLTTLIVNPQYINTTLNGLKSVNIITEDTSKFILELSVKYGNSLFILAGNITKPYEWIRIESYLIHTEEGLKLRSKLWRMDGKIFEFSSSIGEVLTLINHIINKTFDNNNLSEEELKKLDFNDIDVLTKKANDLKRLYMSVRSVISEFENSEQIDKN